MGVKHAFTSAKSDGGDTTLVRPSNWNADHVGMQDGWFNASDYGTEGTGAAIQSAIDACDTAGGGVVYIPPGTWALGSTSLTLPEVGSDGSLMLAGAGPAATVLTYSGTSGAIKHFDVSTSRIRYVGIRDMTIDARAAGQGSSCLEISNIGWSRFINLKLQPGNTTSNCDGIRLVGSITPQYHTYYNVFQQINIIVNNGVGIHFTGAGGLNRNFFTDIYILGESTNAFGMVQDSSSTDDTNMFVNVAFEGTMNASHVCHFGYGTGIFYRNSFVNIWDECSGTTYTLDFDSGSAGNTIIGGDADWNFSSVSDDNMAIVPGTVNLNSNNIGFFGATPITRPTVSGSRGSNAALASLCTALANLGLITDSTS